MATRKAATSSRRLAPALAQTLRALDHTPADAALVRLAEQYAASIDAAVEIADAAALAEPEDADTARLLDALRRRVEAQTVLAELGPKLHAALAELGASPKARAALAPKGGSTGDAGGTNSKLAELRERSRVRASRAAVVDASAS